MGVDRRGVGHRDVGDGCARHLRNVWLPLRVAYTVALLTLTTFAHGFSHQGHWTAGASWRNAITGALIGLFLAVIRAGMNVARQLDADTARLLATGAKAAARTGRDRERSRIDAVVRDEVIAVLRTVQAGRPEKVQRDQAVRALEAMRGRRAPGPTVVDAALAQLRLREAVVGFSDQIAVSIDVDETASSYPAEVITMLIDATGEAVSNALTHAGPEASQVVVGLLSGEGIRLRILDDGVGFDPLDVPIDRIGISTGIVARVAGVEGAAVDIDSAPGEGTMVSLEWRSSGQPDA